MHDLLDQDDRIVAVSEDWQRFAAENDTPRMTPDSVIGRPIWRALSDPETRHIHQELFKRALPDPSAPAS